MVLLSFKNIIKKMLQNVNLISCFNSLVKVDWLKKKKYNLGAFLFNFNSFDLNLFFVNLDKIYNIYIEFHLVYFVSLLGYLYFFYNLFNFFLGIKNYTKIISKKLFAKIPLKVHKLLFKMHGFCFLKQTKIIKLSILFFIIFKLKIIIKLIFFKHFGFLFCIVFLYAQSVFIKNILTIYYFILISLQRKNLDYTLSLIKISYKKYKLSSFFLLFFIIIDIIYFILSFIRF